MAALIFGLFSEALIASSVYFLSKIESTVPNCQILCISLVVGAARISILQKQNVDYMTEKLHILIADHVTSTGHNSKWYHLVVLAKRRSVHIARLKIRNVK